MTLHVHSVFDIVIISLSIAMARQGNFTMTRRTKPGIFLNVFWACDGYTYMQSICIMELMVEGKDLNFTGECIWVF